MSKSADPAVLSDVVLLIGLALAVYGLWLAWHPLGYIIGGAILILLARGTARLKSPNGSEIQ